MGATACKCDCDADDKPPFHPPSKTGKCQFDEDVEVKAVNVSSLTKASQDRTAIVAAGDEAFETILKLNGTDIEETLTFNIEQGKPLGVVSYTDAHVCPGSTVLCIIGVERFSPFYNQLGPGDSIVAIGGERLKCDDMVSTLQAARAEGGQLKITFVRRPGEIEAEVKFRPGEKMGLLVAQHAQEASRLRVQNVLVEGGVPTWNRSNPFRQIVSGDWITAVNGREMSASDLTQAIQVGRQAGHTLMLRIVKSKGDEAMEDYGPRSPNGRSQ